MYKLINFFRPRYSVTSEYVTMLIAGIFALIAAFTLSVEKLVIIKNPDAILSCSVNVFINCANVMQTWQAELFGFPNSYIGVAGFAIVLAVAIGGLLGVKFTRSYLLTAQVFYGLGLIFAYWLFFQSVFVIQVLCPWCLIVTFMTTLIFDALLRINLRENNFGLKKEKNARVQAFLDKDFDRLIVATWIVLMIAIIYVKFGNGLFS